MKRQSWDLEMLKEAANFKRNGQSWGEIAKRYSVETKDLTSAVYRNIAKGRIAAITETAESLGSFDAPALPSGRAGAASNAPYILMPIRQDQIPSFINNFYR